MFKLPNLPSPQSETHELADFLEMLSLIKGFSSRQEVLRYLGRIDENESNEGCEDGDDANSEFLDEVMNEIDRRALACGRGYPFSLESAGTTLRYGARKEDYQSILYLYLLLSTRLNMEKDRIQAGIDGTFLLEEISAHALKNYIGGARARSFVFGTSVSGGFKGKVDDLCRKLKEADGFKSLTNSRVYTKDGKLDAVAWVPFSDSLPGQLIVFAQCKTGSSWGRTVSELQPDIFIRRWIRGGILVTPLRALCISEAVNRSRWADVCVTTGLLLDRCRLVDFCYGIDEGLLGRVKKWTLEAEKVCTKYFDPLTCG